MSSTLASTPTMKSSTLRSSSTKLLRPLLTNSRLPWPTQIAEACLKGGVGWE